MPTEPDMFFEETLRGGEPSLDDYRTLAQLLWEWYGRSVFLYARARLPSVEDAKDLCQDAFVNALEWLQKNPGRRPEKVNFPAWLQRIARNLVVDWYRRPDLVTTLPDDPNGNGGATGLDHWPARRAIAPLERLTREEELAALRHCIEELREAMRRVVVLRDIEELKNKAIGEMLDIPASTVGVTLHRARKKLRECVEFALAPQS